LVINFQKARERRLLNEPADISVRILF
jgi:hypothetical protein